MNKERKNILDYWNLPIDIDHSEMYLEQIRDDHEGKAIFLKSNDEDIRTLKILFTDPLSCQKTTESYLLKLWSEIPEKKLGKIFYKVDKSSYIDFFHEMSFGIYKDWKIQHYAIYTINDCVDILSILEPEVEWID